MSHADDDAPGSARPPRGKFLQVTHDQLALPMSLRASPDGGMSPLQKHVLFGIEALSWGGKRTCRAKDLDIADAVGLTGTDRARRSQIQVALHGRTYRKWNRETGERDGELVNVPGVCKEAHGLGFVEAVQLPTGERELVLTPKWFQWSRFRVFHDGDGDGESTEAAREVPTEAPNLPPAAPITAGPPEGPPAVASDAAPLPEIAGGGVSEPPPPTPPPDAVAAVLGSGWRDAGLGKKSAVQLIEKMRQRGFVPSLGPDALPRWTLRPGNADELSANDLAVQEWLSDEVRALLAAPDGRTGPAPAADGAAPTATASRPPAPRVDPGTQADVRRSIGGLGSRRDDDLSRTLALRLVKAFGDADAVTSAETYFGIFEDLRKGDLTQDLVQAAWESACGKRVWNRGAMFISRLRSVLSADRKGRESPS